MRFRLIEGLVRDMRKYYEDIPESTFQLLVSCDPTNRNMDRDFDNWVAGKYVKWILQKYQKGWFTTDEQQLNNITDMLAEFERLKPHMPSQDINFYKSFDEIYDSIEKAKELEQRYIPSDKAAMRAEKANAANDDLEIVYQNDSFKVYWPKTYPQSREVGRDTSWCTASSDPSYFERYNSLGPLRTIHLNGAPFAQYHIPSRSFLNVDDHNFKWTEFFSVAPIEDVKGLKNFIQSEYDAYDGPFEDVYYVRGQLEDRLKEFPSDEELKKIEKLGDELAEKLRPELVLVADAFTTQDFINWTFDYLKAHSTLRFWQRLAKFFASEKLTRYELFSKYMHYDRALISEYDGCFSLQGSDGITPRLSAEEVRQFNLSLRDSVLHTLFGVFPVSPYVQNIDYAELKYVPSALYWSSDISGTDAYKMPTNVFRIYVRDENEVINSIPRNMLRNRKYRFISVGDFDEAMDKELAYQTKLENDKLAVHESLDESIRDARALLDRSKRITPDIFKQLNVGDYLYSPLDTSFLYVTAKNEDGVSVIPAGADLTLYHDYRPELYTPARLKTYFLIGNKYEISQIEHDLVDKFNYDSDIDAIASDNFNALTKWQKDSGFYTYQDKSINNETEEEEDSDSTDVFVKFDDIEVNLNNGKTIYGSVVNAQWAIDYDEVLTICPIGISKWKKDEYININPSDISNVHIIKLNELPRTDSSINFRRLRDTLKSGKIVSLDGYIFKDDWSDGIKFFFPEAPGFGKEIGTLSDMDELEDAVKSNLITEHNFSGVDFSVKLNTSGRNISRRDNQVIMSCVVKLIPNNYEDGSEELDKLVQYIGAYDNVNMYYKRLLNKVLPSNIITVSNSLVIVAKLNFVRRYTFANISELDEYITSFLPEWLKGIEIFSNRSTLLRDPVNIPDSERFKSGMHLDYYGGLRDTDALEKINYYLKKYHGKFTFQIVLGESNAQSTKIIQKLFKAFPELEEKIFSYALNH